MKQYKSFFLGMIALLATSCGLFSEPESQKPQFDEFTILDITATSIRWESPRIAKGNSYHTLVEYGFMYSTDPEIPIETAHRDGTQYGGGYYNFSNEIDGLNPNTTYYACLYCITSEDKFYKSQTQSFKTRPKGDFSQVVMRTPISDNIELGFIGCYRMDTKVLIEVTIKNTGIRDGGDFRIYMTNGGNTVDGEYYSTHFEDDVYSDYSIYDVLLCMNGYESTETYLSFFSAGALPLNTAKKLKIYLYGVPQNATKLDAYLLAYFYNYSGCPHVYLTFENIPIY